jgi:hypothetical protein
MGLDMYLERKTYVQSFRDDEKYQVTVTKNGKPTSIDPDRVTYITEEVGYWRKANHIHKWFVNHVQEGNDDCGTYYVSEDKMRELLTLCKTVLDNPTKQTKELLPTSSGFFFGSTEYDEGYLQDLENTVSILEKCLSLPKEDRSTFYYHSSW